MKNGTKTAFCGPHPDVGKATQFKPGNPGGGRPRTAKFSEACRELAAEIGRDGKTGARKLAEYCFRRAMKGSVRHAEIFLHYAEGKPAIRSEEELFPTEAGAPGSPVSNDLAKKTDSEIEDFREKILRGETLEIPPGCQTRILQTS